MSKGLPVVVPSLKLLPKNARPARGAEELTQLGEVDDDPVVREEMKIPDNLVQGE